MAFGPNNIPIYEDATGSRVIDSGLGITAFRKNLGAGPQFYVNQATGTDANDGLSATLTGVLHGPTATINAALANALAIDAHQGSITINIAAGTYNENVVVNGPLPGGCSNTGFIFATSEPLVSFVGAGSGVVTVNGGNTVLGQPYAYTFLGNRGGHILLSGMKLQCTHNVSVGSAAYAQFYGSITFMSDIIIDATTGPSCTGEEGGYFEVNPGGATPALTFQGSTNSAISLSAHAMFQSDVTLLFANNPAYNFAAIYADQSSHVKLFGAAATSGSFTGTRLRLGANSSLYTLNGTAFAATGSVGLATTGGVWENVPSATIAAPAPTGVGSTGTVTIDANGDPYHGTIRIVPGGTGIVASGAIYINFPYMLSGGAYVVGISNNGASWSNIPWFTMTDNSATPQIQWANGQPAGVALSAGNTYILTYQGRS